MGGVSSTAGHVTITPIYWAPAGHARHADVQEHRQWLPRERGISQPIGHERVLGRHRVLPGGERGDAAAAHPICRNRGAEVDDATPFPAEGGANCTADAGYTACVDDAALQAEMRSVVTTRSLTADDAHLYVVFFPQLVETCEGSGSAGVNNPCSTNVYCGYHAGFSMPSGQPAIYADMPFPILNGCVDPFNGAQAPNGDSYADAGDQRRQSRSERGHYRHVRRVVRHLRTRRRRRVRVVVYGNAAGSTNSSGDGHNTGTMYNQVIGTGRYYTQDEFSDEEYTVGRGDLTTGTAGGTLVAGCVQASFGPLRVTTSPALPSQISVDGTVADTWGLNWLEVGPGSHQVCFSWVEGYTTPACQTVTVTSGATTTVTGTFVPRGSRESQTSPAVPGQISVDGTPMDDWGVWTDIPTGPHNVCFVAASNFTAPACQIVTVAAGTTTQVTGTYAASPGAPALPERRPASGDDQPGVAVPDLR